MKVHDSDLWVPGTAECENPQQIKNQIQDVGQHSNGTYLNRNNSAVN